MAITTGAGQHRAWLEVDGTTFPIEQGSVSQSSTRKSSSFSATLPMYYPGAYEKFSNLGDNKTSIVVTTRGATVPLLSGEIDSVEFDYMSTSIAVTGRDQSAKLHGSKSSEKWVNKKGSQIVAELAGRVGLRVNVESSVLQAGKQLNQDYVKLSDGISFAAVIHKLAELDGARWWVKNGVLHYQSLTSPTGIYTLNYVAPTDSNPMQGDFLDLRIRRNIQAGKGIKVTVKSWHPKQKKSFEGNATIGGNGTPTEYTYHIPNLLQDHVDQHAKSRASDHARHGITIAAKCVGDPSIDVAMGLQLNGTDAFDRLYQIDSVQHIIGKQGHTMSITAKLPSAAS